MLLRALQNLTIFLLPTEGLDFSEVTGSLRHGEPPVRRGQNSPIDKLLKRPIQEPWPPARLCPGGDSAPEGRAYAPEGTEEVSTLFRKIMSSAKLSLFF